MGPDVGVTPVDTPVDPARASTDGGRSRRSRHGRKRRSTNPADLAALGAVALVGAVLAVWTSDASPTGTAVLDAVERALVVVLVTAAGFRARRWPLVVGSALVAIFAEGWWQVPGVAALVATAALAFTGQRLRLVGAAIGAAIGVTALHLAVPGPLGTEVLVALVAIVPILVSAHRLLGSRARRAWRIAAIAVVVGCWAFAVLAGISTASSISPVEDAVAATRAGVTAAQEGDGEGAAASFQRAREQFRVADRRVGSVLTLGARLLPVVGPNLKSVQASVSLGADLTDSARTIAADVDFDDVQREGGGVDLDLLGSFERPVLRAAAVLERADEELARLRSPWLLAPLEDRLDALRTEVDDLRSQIDSAAVGVRHAPALLGAGAPRRYLFLLGNPAELRDLGGHLGNWAEVVVDGGRIDLVEVGRPLDLSFPPSGTPAQINESDFPRGLIGMDPALHPQNWGSDPDLPTVARLAASLFGQKTGRSLDGVIYADTEAFAGFLRLTGPVSVPGTAGPVVLDATTASAFLTRGQFAAFPDEAAASNALESLIHEVFDRLTIATLPGPRSLSELFWPLVHRGHLQMATLHAQDRPLLDRFGLTGAVPTPEGGDLLAVLNRNAGPNKLDAYLSRSTEVQVQWDPPSGRLEMSVTVELTNGAPASGLSPTAMGNAAGLPFGTNLTDLALMTPHRLRMVRLDGVETAARPLQDDDLWRHTVRVSIPPGATRRATFELEGTLAAGQEYELSFVGQPLLAESPVAVDVQTTAGRLVARGGTPVEGEPSLVTLDGRADAVVSWTSQGAGRR